MPRHLFRTTIVSIYHYPRWTLWSNEPSGSLLVLPPLHLAILRVCELLSDLQKNRGYFKVTAWITCGILLLIQQIIQVNQSMHQVLQEKWPKLIPQKWRCSPWFRITSIGFRGHFEEHGTLTWQWNIPISNRKYIFKWPIFHCYVSLPECMCLVQG